MRIYSMGVAFLTIACVSGCGTVVSNHTTTSGQPANQSVTLASGQTVDPTLYNTCVTIYHGVSDAIANNQETSYDKPLQSITNEGQNSAQGTPNSVLYEDAATVVSMEDAINGEGAPASAFQTIQKALDKFKADLKKYNPQAN